MISDAPGKRPFYKYASPETTLAVLKSRTFRYSSPLVFNDPFDVQSGLHFDFDIEALHGKVLDRIHQLAAAPTEPNLDRDDDWGKIVLEARKYYPTHGFPRDRWEELTAESFAWLVQQIKNTQSQYQQHWMNKLLPGMRVFCVSEDRDDLLMWAHYGRDHTGVVFELWSLPDEDNALSVAQPVQYVDAPPPFFTESEWLDDMVAIKKFNPDTLFRRYVSAKSKHWSYEREWRVWYPLATEGLFDDVPIRPSEFTSLYFGCRATSEFKNDALALLHSSFPNVRVFRALKKEDVYALEYVEI